MTHLTEMQTQLGNKASLRVFAAMLIAAAFILLPSAARADSTATYQVSGTLASGTYSGTIELDHTSSSTTLINSSLTVDGISFSCNGATSNDCIVYTSSNGSAFFQVQDGSALFVLEWDGISLAGPYPSTLTFTTGYCTSCSGAGSDWVEDGGTGTLVATPENATILLFAVGLLGIFLLSRRRLSSPPTA